MKLALRWFELLFPRSGTEAKTQGLPAHPASQKSCPKTQFSSPGGRAKKSSALTGQSPQATSLMGLSHVGPTEHVLLPSGACGLETPHPENLQMAEGSWPLGRPLTLASKLLWRSNDRLCYPGTHSG